MRQKHPRPPQAKRSFGTIWGELDYVCKRMHYWLYGRHSLRGARRFLGRLEILVTQLPGDELAILRQEALALLHELKGHRAGAIAHRRRELELTERLHQSVRRSVAAGDYDEQMAASILLGRDERAINERRAILRGLQDQDDGRPAGKARRVVSRR